MKGLHLDSGFRCVQLISAGAASGMVGASRYSRLVLQSLFENDYEPYLGRATRLIVAPLIVARSFVTALCRDVRIFVFYDEGEAFCSFATSPNGELCNLKIYRPISYRRIKASKLLFASIRDGLHVSPIYARTIERHSINKVLRALGFVEDTEHLEYLRTIGLGIFTFSYFTTKTSPTRLEWASTKTMCKWVWRG